MVDRLREVLATYDRIRQDIEPYTTEVLGKEILVRPNVFSPKYFTDSAYFAEAIPQLVGQQDHFLEIGAGTGVVASFVGLNGVGKLVATDINPGAVENTRQNFDRFALQGDVLQGHLYEPVGDAKFHTIFWNHPFNCVQEQVNDVLLRAGLDEDYQDLEEWFRDGKQHLFEGGQLLLGTGNIARLDLIEALAAKHGYVSTIAAQRDCPQNYDGTEEVETYFVYKFT